MSAKPVLIAMAFAGMALGAAAPAAPAAQLFPLSEVRLTGGPLQQAQATGLDYLLALDPDRLLAPFLREAGLAPRQPPYGNWESSGLDGHMGGHYLSTLAMMVAATGDAEARRRLDYFIAELQRAQQANGDGYLGGIPGGRAAWKEIAAGQLKADSFGLNGKWVPWYNLHKTFAGLRDAWLYAHNADARAMLVALSDWALRLSEHLSDAQMQDMLRAEQGGMNEVLADVACITGERKYLDLAMRFSHRAILEPLARNEDRLSGLHANTQIPKVIGFERIGEMTGQADWQHAAEFFWHTVREHRTVAIGGNSVREHFHDANDFSSMIEEVEGPETCNTYNMLKLTELLFQRAPRGAYADYYERALFNHILSAQHPGSGGFVYFTPLRPQHYRVYSQVDQAMWCCVGSGLESQARIAQFLYAQERDALYINLFAPSTVRWQARGVTLTQTTGFPDEQGTHLRIDGNAEFTLRLRAPGWARGLQLRVNGRAVKAVASDGYISLRRAWHSGDRVDLRLPMHTALEQMPDRSRYYAVLYGPIVLAARGDAVPSWADGSRMGHSPSGPTCPMESAPTFVGDAGDFLRRFRPVPGRPLTFRAPGLVRGGAGAATEFIPFFRLHDARYSVYFPASTPDGYAQQQTLVAAADAERRALEARTVDRVAPGEQQPEADHSFQGERTDNGVNRGRHWRDASGWFSYVLQDPAGEARVLRLTYAGADRDRKFDIYVNGVLLAQETLSAHPDQEFYTRDLALTPQPGPVVIRFVARDGSKAGGLYGLSLLK